MSVRVELHPEALKELQEAKEWYENRSDGLGARFVNAIDSRLQELTSQPDRYAKKQKNYREAGVATFPYVIIYEVIEKGVDTIIFISYIFHTKRNPELKYKRKV